MNIKKDSAFWKTIRPVVERKVPQSYLADLIMLGFAYNLIVSLTSLLLFRHGVLLFLTWYLLCHCVKLLIPYLSVLTEICIDTTLAQLCSIYLYNRWSIQSVLVCMPIILLMTNVGLAYDINLKLV